MKTYFYNFNSRGARGASQADIYELSRRLGISTHAARAGRVSPPSNWIKSITYFNSRGARGASLISLLRHSSQLSFQLTRRARGESLGNSLYFGFRFISTHAARAGRVRVSDRPALHELNFNSRGARGASLMSISMKMKRYLFQLTRRARGESTFGTILGFQFVISTHAARAGRVEAKQLFAERQSDFNSRGARGASLDNLEYYYKNEGISTHAARAGRVL